MKKAIFASAFLLALTITAVGQPENTQPRKAAPELPAVSTPAIPLAGPPPEGNYREVTAALALDAIAQEKRDKFSLNELKASYERLLSEAIPDYNYIKVEAGRHHYHKCLVGLHPFFNQHAFSAGPLARQVGQWLMDHRTALKAHKIKEIGVAAYWHISPENAAFFEVPKLP